MSDVHFVKTLHAPAGTTCLCGNSECSGLTAAFSVMRDARQRFVQLPECHKQRESYIRYLLPNKHTINEESSNYIALHHFHPAVLWEHCAENKIPKTLSCGQAVQLRMVLSEKDKVVGEHGMPAFVFCPNYPREKVKEDLANLTDKTRMQETAESRSAHSGDKKANACVLDIPTHVSVHGSDDQSDVSSIEIIVDEERDAITLAILISAAVTCQKTIRCYLANRVVQRVKEEESAVLVLQSCARRWIVMSKLNTQQEAATAIQSKWRGLVAYTMYERQVKNATIIQSVVRGRLSRQKVQHEVAIVIQTKWRGFVAVKVYQRQVKSATGIQSVVRGHLTRKQVHRDVPFTSAVTIQTAWRRYVTRRDYRLYLNDVVIMQSLVRQRLAVEELERRKTALLVLESTVRRWIAVRNYTEKRGASTAIQTKWRQHVAQSSYSRKFGSAIVIQRSCRGLLVRRHVQARTASALRIQRAWKRNRHQIQLNREQAKAAIIIQAVARGFLCRKNFGWMMTFARLKVAECQRRKTYESLLENACTTWTQSIEVLESGVREIARAERLIVGTCAADQALATALRSIAQDVTLDNDDNSPTDDDAVPTDPVLKSLISAHANMADRYDDVSECGIKEIGPQLASFWEELEVEVKEIKRTGNDLVKTMPTSEMKTSEKATQRAWDELERTVLRLWKGGESSSTGKVHSLPTIPSGQKPTRRKRDDMLVPFPDLADSFVEEYYASPPTSPKVENPIRENSDESTLSPRVTPPPPSAFPVSAEKTAALPPEMKRSSFADDTSPQSVITMGENNVFRKNSPKNDLELTRQSSGYSWKDGMPMTPSSRRSLFGRQQSEGHFALSRDLSYDDCISIMSEEGRQKHGKEFFEHLSETILTKNASSNSPEWPSLKQSPSFGSSCVEDRWLLESNYRAAATHQALVWNACLGLLKKTSEAVKDIELERCVTLNTILTVALPLERRMLLEMREVHENVVNEFLGIRHDKEHVTESIESTIEHHSRLLRQRDSDHKSIILNRSKSLLPDLSDDVEPLAARETYGITHHALVVERSVGLRSWKTTLVVVTVDRCMHLFDLSFIPDITVGSSPTEAFDKLLPNDDFPHDKPIVPRTEKLLQHLSPVTTVNLRKCRISSGDKGSIEVTERYVGRFRGATRRFFLRGEAADLASWKHFLTRKFS